MKMPKSNDQLRYHIQISPL